MYKSAAKTKKTETPTSALGGAAVTEQSSLISSESPAISIAIFLEYVKSILLVSTVFSKDLQVLPVLRVLDFDFCAKISSDFVIKHH